MKYVWVIMAAWCLCACGNTGGGYPDGVFRGQNHGARPYKADRHNVSERMQIQPSAAFLCSYTRSSFSGEYRPMHESINYYFSRLTVQRKSWRNAAEVQEAKRIDLEAYEFGFSPRRLRVRKGDRLIIYVTSRDIPHAIAIDGYEIRTSVRSGWTKAIRFQADKAGEFLIRCAACCEHGHQGMTATLIVDE